MRRVCPFSLVMVLGVAAACGGATTTSSGDGGPCSPVPIHCLQGSCIDAPPPTCENGNWVCKDGPPACYADGGSADASAPDGQAVVDAGGDASCPLVPLHCRQGSCTDDPPPVCVDGAWVCPMGPPSCYADSGGAVIACGPLSCDSATQYCRQASGGPPPPPDAGSDVSYTCESLPPACGASPTCACIQTNGCMCAEQGGQITVTCEFP